MYRYSIPLFLMLSSSAAYSAAFSSCPSEAFLFQGSPVTISSLNLVSGKVTVLETDASGGGVTESGNINSVGYNASDNYIYGFSINDKEIRKIGSDYKIEASYDVLGLPDLSFPAGDVDGNMYYLYKKGQGLYKIDLTDFTEGGSLQANLVSGSTTVRQFTDLAMHPSDGYLYAVDNKNGRLYRINTTTGVASSLGNTLQKGVFGAMFFDASGVFYFLRNNDGAVFRILDLNTSTLAERFSNSASVRQNDGVRCNQAVLPVADMDFGDAPDTYGTLLASGGARHDISDTTYYMGTAAPDAEVNGQPTLSDDAINIDDEGDGVSLSSMSVGRVAALSVNVPVGTGYLNAWADWNMNGTFDHPSERIVASKQLTAGANTLLFDVPMNSGLAGQEVWLRFRYSSESVLTPTGGAPDGEVEDHKATINATPTNIYTFPNSGVYTAAFEDGWPKLADYDLNDAVFNYKVEILAQGSSVKQLIITGLVEAIGADYQYGLALHFEDLLRSDIDESNIIFKKKGVVQSTSPLEAGQTNTVLILSDNAKTEFPSTCSSGFYRTDNDCQQDASGTFEIVLPIKDGSSVSITDLPSAPYDPFIFSSVNRGIEVHAEDHAPTDLGGASNALFNTVDDSSDTSEGEYYRNANNLPWGVVINGTWAYPRERTDLTEAYPNFANYVLDEIASDHADWYIKAKRQSDKVYGSE